jgi:hypothetical protein
MQSCISNFVKVNLFTDITFSVITMFICDAYVAVSSYLLFTGGVWETPAVSVP